MPLAAPSRYPRCSPTGATASPAVRPGWSGSPDGWAADGSIAGWEDGHVAGLEDNLRSVRARIDAAARTAGRDPGTVALIAVSKTWPAAGVRELVAAGQLDLGETRAQELLHKAPELGDLPLRWHFVGQLQRNKAAAVARLGAVVHTVDREPLARVLDRAGQEGPRPVDVLVQ